MPGTPRLELYGELNYIEAYASKFSLDPDYVWNEKAFDDVMIWIEKWQKQVEFEERYMEIERMMNESKQQ